MNDATSAAEPIEFDRLSLRPGYRLLIIGSNGGIGAALTSRAASIGAEVVGFDTPRAIAERPLPGPAQSISTDVVDAQSVSKAFAQLSQRWDAVDGFVYVTGIGTKPQSTLATTLEDWDRTQDVNLRGAFLTAKTIVPLLRRSTGAIVFISSGLAINVESGFSAYSASKAGLLGFMKVLAKELAPDIRVNAVAPGLVETPFLGGGTGQGGPANVSLEDWFGGKERAQAMRDAIPLRRIAGPDDIVAPILFLLSSGARFITGQTLHVNGGRFLP
jgi:3-oxoacyl-[acyl-carrier protein] reductase